MTTYAQTLSEQIADYMAANPKTVLYGMGVADGATWALGLGKAAHARFPERCWDAPACEATLTGMLIGLSDLGWQGILVHCRSNFAALGLDMEHNHMRHWEHLYGRKPLYTMICIVGDTRGQGAQHSSGLEFAERESLQTALSGGYVYEVPLSKLREEVPV
jgi:pyruvate/2-oxoglutarate/acetoin dehydrogenase E1 component